MNTTTATRPAATIPTLKGEVAFPATEGATAVLTIGRTAYTLTRQTVGKTAIMRGTLRGPRGATYGIMQYLDQSRFPANARGVFLMKVHGAIGTDPLGPIGLVIVTDEDGSERIGYTGTAR